jgi:hypothetical protein
MENEAFVCHCGNAHCRGTITADPLALEKQSGLLRKALEKIDFVDQPLRLLLRREALQAYLLE